jgi:hypothetical protein
MGRFGLLMVLLLGAAGCGQAAAPAAGEPVALERPAAVHCPTTKALERPPIGALPEDFAVAWVLRCHDELRTVPRDGTWFFRVEERADTSAAALVAALRRADEKAPAGTVCPNHALAVAHFALVGATGAVVYPRVPRDMCGQPQREAVAALAALRFRVVATTRMHQEQSQKSIDTGCGQMWTDGLGDEVLASDKPAAARRLWQKKPDSLLICLWRSRTTGYPELLSAGTVSGFRLTALLARLDALPAARPCTARHTTFAVIQYVRRGWYDAGAYVELDGCRRIERPDHTLGRADPTTAELLTTLARA